MTPHAQPTARAGRREWIGLAVIALPCLVYAMDLTVLTLAIPSLTAELAPSATELLWIADVYGFLVAGLLIGMGALGDRIGRRRLLLIGAAAFGAASVLAALAWSPATLIAARALLGVAGASIAPSTLSLIRSMFHDDRQRQFAVSVWITSFSAGAAVGPLAGGLLLEHFWWGSVFLPAVPVMALLLVLGPRYLPEYREPEPGRIDLPSVALSLAAVLAVVYGAKTIATHGLVAGGVAPVLAGLALGALFADRQRRLDDPVIDLALFRVPGFGPLLGANTLAFAVVFGLEVICAQYLQLVLGLSPLTAGLWSLPGAAAFVLGAPLTPVLAARLRPVPVMLGGLVIALAGVALLAQAGPGDGPVPVSAGAALLALGLAPVITLAADVAVGASPPERAGAAAGISETSSELGGALGIAVLGTIATAVYRGAMEGAPGEARETLGGALAAADRLPPGLRGDVLGPARDAFTQGLHAGAAVGGALVAAAALLVASRLRPRRARGRSAAAAACA